MSVRAFSRHPSAVFRGAPPCARVYAAGLFACWALAGMGCRDLRPDSGYCTRCQNDAGLSETSSAAQSESSSDRDASLASTSAATGGTGASIGVSMPRLAGAGAASAAMGSSTAGSSGSAASTPGSAATSGSAGARSGSDTPGRDAGSGMSPNSSEAGSAGPSRGSGGHPADPPPRDAGSMEPPPPCGAACPADRPVCDAARRECLACTTNELGACESSSSVCSDANECVECTRRDDHLCQANATKPVCDEARQVCVECTAARSDRCPADKPLCATDQRCVQCREARNCSAQLPTCSETGACTGCQRDSDCAPYPATPRCETTSRDCVACTVDEQCPRSTCDMKTHACLPEHRGDSKLCDPCGVDEQCEPRAYCVAMGGSKVCVPQARDPSCNDMRIYRRPQPEVSNAGTVITVCLPQRSCQAVRDLASGKTCVTPNPTSMECGGGEGACIGPTTAGHCSYICSADDDCPSGNRCASEAAMPMQTPGPKVCQ